MTKNLLRLSLLAVALYAAFGLNLPRPALAQNVCGTGDFFVSCTKTCCGPGVQTKYTSFGAGSSCTSARSACGSCLPACPAGQTLCSGPTYGACAT